MYIWGGGGGGGGDVNMGCGDRLCLMSNVVYVNTVF